MREVFRELFLAQTGAKDALKEFVTQHKTIAIQRALMRAAFAKLQGCGDSQAQVMPRCSGETLQMLTHVGRISWLVRVAGNRRAFLGAAPSAVSVYSQSARLQSAAAGAAVRRHGD